MAINLTGQKYGGTITTASQNKLTDSAANFQSGDFSDDKRIAIIFDSNGVYKAMAYISKMVSSSELELNYAWFDGRYLDCPEVTIANGDTYKISFIPKDISVTGWTYNANQRTLEITDEVILGNSSGSKDDDLVLYLEDLKLTDTYTGAQKIKHYGGVLVLGRLADKENKITDKPVNILWTHTGSSTVYTQMSSGVGVYTMFGGELYQGANYNKFGIEGGGSNYGNSLRLTNVSFDVEMYDEHGRGVPAQSVLDKFIIENCKAELRKDYQVILRNVFTISGGTYSIGGNARSLAMGVIGFRAPGDYTVGAPPGQRLNIIDYFKGTTAQAQSLYQDFGASNVKNIRWQNVLTSNRKHKLAINNIDNNVTGSFIFVGKFTGVTTTSKGIIIRDSDKNVEASGAVVSGAKKEIDLEVLQEVVKGVTSQELYDGWTWGIIDYTKNILSESVNTSTNSDGAKDVIFGNQLVQSDDNLISETDVEKVKIYGELETPEKLYDFAKHFLYENYNAESATILSRVGDKIVQDGLKITIDKDFIRPAFSATSTYKTDDKVTHNNGIYKAKEDLSAGAFDVSKWDLIPSLGSVFERDSTSHITIKADTFSGNFDLGTTGELELLTGATHTGFVIDKNGDAYLIVEGSDSFSVYGSAENRKNESNSLAKNTKQFRFNTSDYAIGSILYLIFKAGSEYTDVDFTVANKGENKYIITTGGKLTVVDNKIDKLLEISKILDSRIESVGIHLETYSVAETEEINLDTSGVTVSAGTKTGTRSLTLLSGTADVSGTIKIPQTSLKFNADTFIVPKISYTKVSTEPTNFSYEIVLEIEHVDGGFHNLASESFTALNFDDLNSGSDPIMGQVGQKLREYDFDHTKIKNYIVKLILGIPNSADTFTATLSDDITFNEHEILTKEVGKHLIKVDTRQIEGEDATDQLKTHNGGYSGTVSRLLIAKETKIFTAVTAGTNQIVVEDDSPTGTFNNHYLIINDGSVGPYQRQIISHTNDGTRSTYELNGFVSDIASNTQVLVAIRTNMQDGRDNTAEIEAGRDAVINSMKQNI